jgi:hypothetical protein
MDNFLLSPNVLAEGNNFYFLDNYFPPSFSKKIQKVHFGGLPPLKGYVKILRLNKNRGVGLYTPIPAKKCRGYPLPSLRQLLLFYE